jgi:hypothetical protein
MGGRLSCGAAARPPPCGICLAAETAVETAAETAAETAEVLACGHRFHSECLAQHLQHRPPAGLCSLQVHDTKLGCPTCSTPLPAARVQRFLDDVTAMEAALQAFVDTEYPAAERPAQAGRRRHSTETRYHWCEACSTPQYLAQRAGCSERLADDTPPSVPPCPRCHPEHYQHQCPQCGGTMHVTHGCTQIRHCRYGERCGANRTAPQHVEGYGTMPLPAPQPCDHGGGCGCPFLVAPAPADLADLLPGLADLAPSTVRTTLNSCLGQPYLLPEYFTMHTPGCHCPGCRLSKAEPEAFARLRRRQLLAFLPFLAEHDDY